MSRLAGVAVALAATVRADDYTHEQDARVVAGRDFSLFLEPLDNLVYGSGRNNYGQLGSAEGDSDIAVQITFPIENANQTQPKVVAAAAGAFHSMFLTDDSCLWMTGRNHKKQIADVDHTDAFYTQPFLWRGPGNCNVIAIAAGYAHSLILANIDGRPKLHALGWNAYGQLGETDMNNDEAALPAVCTDIKDCNITAVAAGYDTSFAVTQDGRAFAWGNNFGGQLGIGLTGNTQPKPTEVSATGGPVKEIVAGVSHTLFRIQEDGAPKGRRIYATGANFAGQLGIGQSGPPQHTLKPMKLDGLENLVTKVVAGGDSSCIIGGNHDDAFCAGSNLDGQLGVETDESMLLEPRKISRELTSVDRFALAALGDSHGLYLDTEAHVYTTGANTYGQLAAGNLTSRNRLMEPPAITLTPVTSTTVTTTQPESTMSTTTPEPNETETTRDIQVKEDDTDWTLIGWTIGLGVTVVALCAGFWAQGQAAKYAADDEESAEVELVRNAMSA